MVLVVHHCPQCGNETDWEIDCPGYGTNPIMVCYPPCGNAIRYVCTNCSWWFRDPNRRSTEGMGVEPPWLLSRGSLLAGENDDDE